MALYQLTASGTAILRETDGAFIPIAPGNLDYQAYLAWVAAGNIADPAPAAAAAPTLLTPLAFMARLTAAEQTAIATAGQSNASVLLFLLEVAGASYVSATDPRTIAGVNAIVAAGLLTAARAAQILNYAVTSP